MGRRPKQRLTRFHEWLESALDKNGLSLSELARRTGANYSHLWKIAQGDSEKYPTSNRPGYELTVMIGKELRDLEGALKAAGWDTDEDLKYLETPEFQRLQKAFVGISETSREALARMAEALLAAEGKDSVAA